MPEIASLSKIQKIPGQVNELMKRMDESKQIFLVFFWTKRKKINTHVGFF